MVFGNPCVEEMYSCGRDELITRDSGPLQFGLQLQPIMASILANRLSLNDACEARSVYSTGFDTWLGANAVTIAAPAEGRGQALLLRQRAGRGLPISGAALGLSGADGYHEDFAGDPPLLVYLLFRGFANRLGRRMSSNKLELEGKQ
jgi:hypothetical protein